MTLPPDCVSYKKLSIGDFVTDSTLLHSLYAYRANLNSSAPKKTKNAVAIST